MFTKNSRVVVISPHSDDMEIGCGGLVAKLQAMGALVIGVLVLATDIDGIKGKTRLEEYDAGCKRLGNVTWKVLYTQETHGCLDSRLDFPPIRDLIEEFEEVMDVWHPDTVLVTKGGYHQDHQAVERAIFAALRPSRKYCPKNLLLYEQPTLVWGKEMFKPNLYVDIGDFIDIKIEALGEHKSQMGKESLLINQKQVKEWASVRGMEAGCEYAEAFEVVRVVV